MTSIIYNTEVNAAIKSILDLNKAEFVLFFMGCTHEFSLTGV